MIKQIIPLSCFFVLLLVSCSMKETTKEFPYGSYSYRSFNITGELIGDGSLYISEVDSNTIQGNWSIRNVKNCNVCGPQFGTGFLKGRIEKDSIFINLNPNTPQNYVELVGKIENGLFSGEWKWFELIVNSNRGNFRAIRN